jgi:hypothetical protein
VSVVWLFADFAARIARIDRRCAQVLKKKKKKKKKKKSKFSKTQRFSITAHVQLVTYIDEIGFRSRQYAELAHRTDANFFDVGASTTTPLFSTTSIHIVVTNRFVESALADMACSLGPLLTYAQIADGASQTALLCLAYNDCAEIPFAHAPPRFPDARPAQPDPTPKSSGSHRRGELTVSH